LTSEFLILGLRAQCYEHYVIYDGIAMNKSSDSIL
jgi:hypothetical protein